MYLILELIDYQKFKYSVIQIKASRGKNSGAGKGRCTVMRVVPYEVVDTGALVVKVTSEYSRVLLSKVQIC